MKCNQHHDHTSDQNATYDRISNAKKKGGGSFHTLTRSLTPTMRISNGLSGKLRFPQGKLLLAASLFPLAPAKVANDFESPFDGFSSRLSDMDEYDCLVCMLGSTKNWSFQQFVASNSLVGEGDDSVGPSDCQYEQKSQESRQLDCFSHTGSVRCVLLLVDSTSLYKWFGFGTEELSREY